MVVCQCADVGAIVQCDPRAGGLVKRSVSRRAVLGGVAAWLGAPVLAQQSLRPVARPDRALRLADLIAQAGLSGQLGYVVQDLASGQIIDAHNAAIALPPASVTKAVTAAYGLDRLGAQHRYVTRILAQGPIQDGILAGDLILAGGGDPNLGTDDLADLLAGLAGQGLRGITGNFLVWDGALPQVAQIDASQPAHLGYNPAIAGLNLNYNRVYFAWQTEGNDITTTLDARSDRYQPAVNTAQIRIVERDLPVFAYSAQGDLDSWSVARNALNAEGSRWLPVRNPALYAGDVFASLARNYAITLPAPQRVNTLPPAQVLVQKTGAPLPELIKDMLRYSTNLTAEVLGLTASQAADLRGSAQAMAQWADLGAVFVDHSGLGDQARISPAAMTQFLRTPRVAAQLRPLLREIALVDSDNQPVLAGRANLRAKTGTLHFVSTLAGYLGRSDGRDLAFAIFAADLDARAIAKTLPDETPPGARAWAGKARRVQQQILQHWAVHA
jgi:serine-type D-Ala-D-Ala carboxypeptidase/endopeptidase (penicillin-binding protein 4)